MNVNEKNVMIIVNAIRSGTMEVKQCKDAYGNSHNIIQLDEGITYNVETNRVIIDGTEYYSVFGASDWMEIKKAISRSQDKTRIKEIKSVHDILNERMTKNS